MNVQIQKQKLFVMKTLYKLLLLIVLATFFINNISAQSLRGNMKSEANSSLSYGNVDIYKGDEKVASVLTDEEGNFNVKLDTGLYRVEMQYAGYEKEIKEIRITSDERTESALKKDKNSKVYDYVKEEKPKPTYHTERTDEALDVPVGRSRTESRGYDASFSDEKFLPEGAKSKLKGIGNNDGKAGVLTAGEINDFSKWNMWQDIVNEDLNKYKAYWKMQPQDRYSIQLTNDNGFPVVDAEVHLIDDSGDILYVNRTDNTGKSELWGGLFIDVEVQNSLKCKIYYNDQAFEIRKLIPFYKGVNTKKINVDCSQNDMVDIAFVVDATGSMGDEINFLKKEINDVIYETKNMNQDLTFNFANVFYRDHGEDYLTKKHDFTDVLSESVAFINQQSAAGGGDFEEAVEIALDTAINSLNWSENARARILFLVLDAPPHNSPEIRKKLESLMRQAANNGVRIVPLVASGINKDAEYLMRTIALATNGTYAFLTNHSGVGGGHIEPTTNEYDVELLNDLMKRIIKSYIFVPECDDNPNDEPDIYDSLFVKDDQRQEEVEWSFWPNPTQGEIQIKVDRDIDEMFLTDLSGKIMERFTGVKRNRILRRDLSQYAKGVYLLTFNLDDKVVSGKVILQ